MGRWVIVGFVILAGVVFVLTRPTEQAGDETQAASQQRADSGEPVAVEPEPMRAADKPDAATPTDDQPRYEFAKLDPADARAGDREPSPWTQGRDGFDPPRIDPEALELLENPPEPIPPPNWDEVSTHRYVYPDHIEALIDGSGESRHKQAVDEFMRENPPGPDGYKWSEVDDAFELGRKRQAKSQ